jgi:putative glutamine amidotransferase
MCPRIALPEPKSGDPDYTGRALPQYVAALEQSGAEPVIIRLHQLPEEIAKAITNCDGVLLPGSAADVDPQKYFAQRRPECGPADPLRDTADELLIQDAYNLSKPILGICYGMQSLNVWRSGTLVQDIHSSIDSPVNHRAGRDVAMAHQVAIDPGTLLAKLAETPRIGVNSSHHQAVDVVGDGLRVSARCPDDNIVEALEGTAANHFVVAVQWHPERSLGDPLSRRLFASFVQAAEMRRQALSSGVSS